jgi:hypothetical protein
MRRNHRIPLLLTALLLIAVVALSLGVYARYREEISGDPAFQVKPMAQLRIAQQKWQQAEDAAVLTFSMEQAAQTHVYLAMSEGVTAPGNVEVLLTLPGVEPVTLLATGSEIPEVSGLKALFGSGYVFRFLDPETGEEQILELPTEECVLTVRGLDAATEQTSLLRLFVEYAQE